MKQIGKEGVIETMALLDVIISEIEETYTISLNEELEKKIVLMME